MWLGHLSPCCLAGRSPWADRRPLLPSRWSFQHNAPSGGQVELSPPLAPAAIGGLALASPDTNFSLEYSTHNFGRSFITKPISNCPISCGDLALARATPISCQFLGQRKVPLFTLQGACFPASEPQWRPGVCFTAGCAFSREKDSTSFVPREVLIFLFKQK